jgi:DNA invertase Pin-like site-specific DNA recombinase
MDFSQEGQIELCANFCQQHSLQVVEVYVDCALSEEEENEETVHNRLSQLLDKGENHEFDVVVTLNQARFTRNLMAFEYVQDQLGQAGIVVETLQESFMDIEEILELYSHQS